MYPPTPATRRQLNGEIRQFHGVGVIGDVFGRIYRIFTGEQKELSKYLEP